MKPILWNRWQKKQGVLVLLVLITLQLFAITTLQAFAYAAQLNAPAVVVLTPQAALQQENFTIPAVLGIPDATKHEVQARRFTATSPTQTVTAPLAVGHAVGQLFFSNQSATNLIIPSTVFTSKSGVQVTFNGPLTLPATSVGITVPAFAIEPGPRGNIPARDLYELCCEGKVLMGNPAAFTGGQDAQPTSTIQQGDIDAAGWPLLTELAQDAMSRLNTTLHQQMRLNERLAVSSLQCQPSLITDHLVGDIGASTITVKGSVTCGEEMYDDQAAQVVAVQWLQEEAAQDGYPLIPHVSLFASPEDTDGTALHLYIQARSIGILRYSPQDLQEIAHQIAGLTQGQARSLLYENPLIYNIQFRFPGNVPKDAGKIRLIVQNPSIDLPLPPTDEVSKTINCSTTGGIVCDDPPANEREVESIPNRHLDHFPLR